MVIESNVAGAAGKPGTRLFGDHVSDQNSVLASFGGVAVADRRGRTRRRNDPSRHQPETSAPTPTPPGRVGSQRSIGELAGCRRSHEPPPKRPISQETPETPLGSPCECHLALPPVSATRPQTRSKRPAPNESRQPALHRRAGWLPTQPRASPKTPNQPRNPRNATWQFLRMPLGVTTSLPPPAPKPGRNGPRQTRVGSQRSIGELAGCRRSHELAPKTPNQPRNPRNATWQFVPMSVESPHISSPTWHTGRTRLSPCRTRCTRPGISL